MKPVRLLVPFILAMLLGSCAADSPIDCSKTSVADCESEGCSLKTGNIFNEQDLCLDAPQTFGCEAQNQTSNRLLVTAVKGDVCGHFFNEPPEGWIEAEEGDCSELMADAPLCENTSKCEDLSPSDCSGPRCMVLEGRRFVGPMDGVDSVGCFEAPEPLGCMNANSNCPNNIPATLYEGSCYTFQSGCLPKGWEESQDCPSLNDEMCE